MTDFDHRATFTRRETLLGLLGASVGPWFMPDLARATTASASPLFGRRILTLNVVIRVNQIEASPTSSIGQDEAALHTPELAMEMRSAFAKGFPGGRITWAFSWLALHDQRPNYVALRKLAAEFHHEYGDDVTFIPGGYFANMYSSREAINPVLHEGLQVASDIVGGGFRPKSVIAGFLASENQRFLAEHEGIHVCQGNIWSQYAIDNGGGDGSISYPYYPSREHFCKPAQGKGDFIDCVNLDGWTVDFLCARRPGFAGGFNSRLGVGPIEALINSGYTKETGLREMMETTAIHFDRGFEINRFAWVTDTWELSLFSSPLPLAQYLTEWLTEIRERWPDAQCPTLGEFGLAWRRQFKDNKLIDYRFVERGAGIGGSDANLEIRWFMNRDFRLALLRDWKVNSPEQVIDFTRYDLPASEPTELVRDWSLMNVMNQKGVRPQDRRAPLLELSADDRAHIHRRYPDLI